MSSLSIFPTEILECITSMATSSQQMRLWQCGDSILNAKLKNGGLKRTSLCWSRSCWMPWPRWYFTTFDSLEDVEWDVDLDKSLCPTLEFNLLPKTLKRLHLACDDVFVLLKKQNVHMNDLLPILHTLHLSGRRLCEENLKNLPSNLFELYVDSRREKIKTSTIFCDLPRTIQRLTLRFEIVDESEHGNDLPSELVSLDIHSLKSNFNWLSKLPKSLKTLKIWGCYFDPSWDSLPSQLEELELETHSFVSESVLLLPQSLRTLEFQGIRGMESEDEFVSLLPKNLTRFRLVIQDLSSHVLPRLPASLIDLQVDISVERPDVLSLFPPQATRIHLGLGEFYDELNFPFPTNLQYLRVSYMNDDMCAMLPPGLLELYFEEGLITTEGASKLPKSLTSLTAELNAFDDNESISYLRRLSKLDLRIEQSSFGDLNSEWLSSLVPSSFSSTPNHDSVSGCAALDIYDNDNNFHLTSLALKGSPGNKSIIPQVQKPFFDSLHKFKTLKTLQILWCGGIANDWLPLIPHTVTNLEIPLRTFPSANQLSALPACLRYLELEVGNKCDWTDEVLQSLPRSLHTFWTTAREFPNLTERMYEYIPPYLMCSTLKHKTGSSYTDFIPPMERLH